jgi:16S rRNA (guanine966-N2)-methyltransferase
VRIIAGRWRGRRLVSFKADHIRPTTDRVKESVFNRWQALWEGARVLDLYAGTGNLGLEALSRGAREVVAVELNPKSIEIIRKNVEELEVGREHRVIRDEVVKFLNRYTGEGFDLILADPPFTESLAHETLLALSGSKVLKPGTQIMIEASSHERVEAEYPPLVEELRRDYGDKQLSFWTLPETAHVE